MNAGFNTVTWDLRYPAASSFPGMILWGGNVNGPLAAPGAGAEVSLARQQKFTAPCIV